MSDKNLSGMEELLQPAGFFRISRADLVNLEHAREIIPWFSGTYKLKLTTGQELDVSRDRARRLKELMNL
jgi:two-component system LytT family response regulator